MPQPGRELKYALNRVLQDAAHHWLVDQRGADLPDELLIIGEYDFEIQPLEPSQFVIRAKPLDDNGQPSNRPALHFDVSIRGGG